MSDTPLVDAAAEKSADMGLAKDFVAGIWPLARQLERENAKLKADAERLNWAEKNPLDAYAEIVRQWADCGRGGREVFFNFRHAIDAARKGNTGGIDR